MEKCRKNHSECPFRVSKTGCRVILHHLFYPESQYEEGVEVDFRELLINRVPMCEYEEKELHKKHPNGPPKPTLEVMQHCVNVEKQRRELAARGLRKP